jgi:hypothetical protein
MSFEPLIKAEKLFYQVGLSADETMAALTENMSNVERMARFIAAYIYSIVVGNPNLLTSDDFVCSLDLENLTFDPAKMREQCDGIEMKAKTKPAMQSDFTRIAGDFLMKFKATAANHSEEKVQAEEHENCVAQPRGPQHARFSRDGV